MENEKGISLVSILIVMIIALIIVIGAIFVLLNTDNLFNNRDNGEDDDVIIVNDTLNETTNEIAQNEPFFVLYDGVEIEKNMAWINLYDNMVELSKESEQKYNTKYYNYEKNQYIGESEGIFEYKSGGYNFVDRVGKVAITKKYDAIPRTSTKLNTIPKELEDMMDYSFLEIESIDLDGDENQEYIVLCGVDYKENQIGDGEPEASSQIMLLDSSYKKIGDLVNLEDGFTSTEKTEESKVFLSLEDVMYIDIDEDGIMEIIIKVPTYEEEEISILKYSNGKLEGDTNVEAKVLAGTDLETTLKQTLENYLTLYSLSDDGAPLLCSYDSENTYGLQLYNSYEEMEQSLEPSGKAIKIGEEQMRLYKTNIKYDTYKKAMLNYVSEKLFEKQFTKLYKNIDGILCVVSNAGDGESYEIVEMEKTKNDNIYKVICNHSVGENKPEKVTIAIKFEENSSGNYIVSDCAFK